MKIKLVEILVLVGGICLLAAPLTTQAAGDHGRANVVYVAHLHAMNSNVTGYQAIGEARFTITGDTLTIRIRMQGVPPDIEHWQHFHGFKDNHAASCPTATADVNHDGIIDLIETEPASGITMVPFNDNPAATQIVSDTYPKTSADGAYRYQETVSLKAMKTAFAKAFGNADLDLDRRVVFIHGVPMTVKLPASVASLGTIPAQVTLPIACGKIERIR
ncbi:MAG TPA: hypothetical protein VNI53_07300 [Gammaproteobacteria bacterium]|nr:hypothetical protein [Gammaproteobacteria bacterium]